VKAEGGLAIIEQVRAILAAGIPFIGHLGMLPQHILEEGRYRIKGKLDTEHAALLVEARALSDAGACCIVLELVTPPVAKEITGQITAPTIGIGSGPDCDGQILVTHDLIGMFPWFTPKFAKVKATCGENVRAAARAWLDEVRAGTAGIRPGQPHP
jgi:3-methyl-2-oxobutanoate hydroxymethyltransferase